MSFLSRLAARRPPASGAKPYRNPRLNPDCAEFEVNNWDLSEFVLKELVPCVGVHPYPLTELMLMSAATTYFAPSHVFEWGTHIGKAARCFHEMARHFDLNMQIHSTDLPDDVSHVEHPHQNRGALVRDCAGVALHQGDGVSVSLDLYRQAGPASRPLFFLDGDHRYATVKRELEAILAEVAHPVILVHDTFYQSEGAAYNVGPHQAIVDTLRGHPGRFRTLSQNWGLPGMTLIFQNHTGP